MARDGRLDRALTIRGTGIEAVTYDTVTALVGLEPAWRELQARSDTSHGYFQSFDWCASWIKAYALGTDPAAEARVFTVWRDGELALLWPAMISRTSLGGALLSGLGSPHSQYAGALARADLAEPAVLSAAATAITEADDVDHALIEMVPAGNPLTGVFNLAGFRQTGQGATSCLKLDAYPDWAAYQASLSATQRRNRNRRRNQLDRLGALKLSVLRPGDHGYAARLATALQWKRQWLHETGRIGQGLSDDRVEAFLGLVPGHAHAGAVVFSLELDSRPVSIELGFLEGSHYYSYLGSFDWALADYSPGKVAMEMVLRWLMEAGVSCYDLMGTPADYKASWSNSGVALVTCALSLNMRGQIYGDVWLGKLRPGLKQLYQSVPARWRKLALNRPDI